MDAACPLPSPQDAPSRQAASAAADKAFPPEIDFARYVRHDAAGLMMLELVVPDIHCPACIKRIEDTLRAHPGVRSARVNVSTKRVRVCWQGGETEANALASRLGALGYEVLPFETGHGDRAHDRIGRELMLSLAVAGFAAGNIMLLSIAVWSGADGATRDLFHWISALIAIPVIAFAGRPFYRSAWRAIRAGHLNMDVPISLAVILATGMSLFETIHRREMAYFDAAVMLLFFLLVGRVLDHMMRERARSAVASLLSLTPSQAVVVAADGTRRSLPVAEIRPGMRFVVAAGERIPVDGAVVEGQSELDCAHVTGEPRPELATPGTQVLAGALNLLAPLQIEARKPASDSFIADMVRLMEAAEQGKASYMRLADRAARIYAPVVHILAAATFLGWLWVLGDWHNAMFIAISVLIITCPCALGLAVPAVQVVASGKLFANGVMVKDGAALERLAAIDHVVFDKTGTLTLGRPVLIADEALATEDLRLAAGLAQESRHPLSRALLAAARRRKLMPATVTQVREVPGQGLEGVYQGQRVRLGRRDWVLANMVVETAAATDDETPGGPRSWLRVGERAPVVFCFEDAVRPDAARVIEELRRRGLGVSILSGDEAAAVEAVARRLGIKDVKAGLTPERKLAEIEALRRDGHHVLMVGDGLNDAPALAAGDVSMTPAEASDVGRAAASFVFLGASLAAVTGAHRIAVVARRLVTQNFTLSALYNLVVVPIAVLGYASPLVAAIAMSSSSILVTLNALRLRLVRFAG